MTYLWGELRSAPLDQQQPVELEPWLAQGCTERVCKSNLTKNYKNANKNQRGFVKSNQEEKNRSTKKSKINQKGFVKLIAQRGLAKATWQKYIYTKNTKRNQKGFVKSSLQNTKKYKGCKGMLVTSSHWSFAAPTKPLIPSSIRIALVSRRDFDLISLYYATKKLLLLNVSKKSVPVIRVVTHNVYQKFKLWTSVMGSRKKVCQIFLAKYFLWNIPALLISQFWPACHYWPYTAVVHRQFWVSQITFTSRRVAAILARGNICHTLVQRKGGGGSGGGGGGSWFALMGIGEDKGKKGKRGRGGKVAPDTG